MYSVTRLIDIAEGQRQRLLATLQSAAEATQAHHRLVEQTLPGSRNGGNILVHLRFDSRQQWLSAADEFATALTDPGITRVNGATYPGAPKRGDGEAGSVYRALLLRVSPGTGADAIARFETELSWMPRYIPAIRAWQLSRVDDAIGTSSWTHVFEQEFYDLDALMGPYLMHPIHWAVVDRWFDPECPDVIVRDRVCHSFCRCETALPTNR